MYSITRLFDMDTTKEVGNKVEFVLRRLFGEYFSNYHNHGSSSSLIASSQLPVFKDCAGGQPSVISSSSGGGKENFQDIRFLDKPHEIY